jgi:hypothetical protein
MLTYTVASLPLPLYCGILLLAKQHETRLVSIVYHSSMSRSCIILLTISISFIILLIHEQLQLPCCLLILCCSWLAVLATFMSTYSIILLINQQFYYAAHRWAVLVLYCSSLSSCNFHVDSYSGILATPIILWDLAAGKAASDQTCLTSILLFAKQFLYYTGHDEQVFHYAAHQWAVVTSMSSFSNTAHN